MNAVKPTLWVNEAIARRNIRNMANKARRNAVEFKPHFKTHQSAEVGEWFKEEGISSITVSSVDMANYFAAAGWKNITIAFPVNLLQLDEIDKLAKTTEVTLLVVDGICVERIGKIANPVSLMVEIDAGYHRSGVSIDAYEEIEQIIDKIRGTHHHFLGFYCHSGNSYYGKKREEVFSLFNKVHPKLLKLKNDFVAHEPKLSIGDTPTCSIIESFEGVDSIHPGNFVYYDVMQTNIGSCENSDVAVAVECPVVMKDELRNELVIYGGGVHLSKESLDVNEDKIFGLVAREKQDNGWVPLPGTYVKSLSQEHGIISSTPEIVKNITPGDTLFVIPVHSCMTVDCMQVGYTLDNQTLTQINKLS